MIDLTIVIVNYETKDLLLRCLDSVERARRLHPELRIETIVVDNGSRDGSIDRLRGADHSPRIVSLIRNRGYAVAVNLGLCIRRGRHVLLLNTDVEIDPDLLFRGVRILDDRPDAGVLGAALLHSNGRSQRSVHAFPDLESELLPEPILRLFRRQRFRVRFPSLETGEKILPCEVEAVRGAVFFIRGDLLEKLGHLDEGYFFFLEETDYCWRVRAAGYRVLHCASLRARHRLGASSKARAPMATRIEFHRSLYRYLDRRCGLAVSTVARLARILRMTISVLGLAFAAMLSARARRRLAERWGLLLWHLRGRPLSGALAETLRMESTMNARIGERHRVSSLSSSSVGVF